MPPGKARRPRPDIQEDVFEQLLGAEGIVDHPSQQTEHPARGQVVQLRERELVTARHPG